MALRLSLFYIAIFTTVGVFLPFWPVWLAARGLDAPQIGALIALATLLRAAINPLAGSLADRRGDPRGVLMVTAWAAAAGFALFALAEGFWTILAVTVIAAACYSPLIPLGETIAVQATAARGLDYGRVRLWGSLAFIAAAAGMGHGLAAGSESLILWTIVAALVATACAARALPAAPRGPAPALGARPVRRLLGERRFVLFLLAGSLLQASHAVYYGFATLHWRAAGIADEAIGALWALGVVAEVALFTVSGRAVRRFGPVGLFALAALSGIVRWSVLAATISLPLLAAAQTLHGFTFGAAHLAAMHFIQRNVPREMAASAQTLYGGLALGIVMAATTAVAGPLFAAAGGGAFLAMAGVSAAGGGLVALLARATADRSRA